MNLTLAVDDRLVERARKIAESQGKSLNQVIREYLEELTSPSTAAGEMEELRRLSLEGQGRSRGWKFDRREIHERT
ncbi:MAG TPA: DUF6364 family protein [Thermoanaerobaculia bacterium]|nr:DUF6364 family protein [Thermoanaerobaculia bacterium]